MTRASSATSPIVFTVLNDRGSRTGATERIIVVAVPVPVSTGQGYVRFPYG
jgi:hypothetical protein